MHAHVSCGVVRGQTDGNNNNKKDKNIHKNNLTYVSELHDSDVVVVVIVIIDTVVSDAHAGPSGVTVT